MRRALAAVLLVALAGCSSVVVGTESPTVTPVDVPSGGTPVGDAATATATPGNRLAPGLTEDGVTDPFALADAHRASVENRSFTAEHHRSIRAGNGTLRSVDRRVRVAPGGAPYYLVRSSQSHPDYPVESVARHVELWFDGTESLFRVGVENPTFERGVADRPTGPVDDVTYHDRLVVLYSRLDWRVAAKDVDSVGTAYYDLRADGPSDPQALAVPALVSAPENVSARVVVTGDGRVHRLRVSYDARIDGRRVRVDRALRFDLVGRTTVERPGWYDAAVNATGKSPGAPPTTPRGG